MFKDRDEFPEFCVGDLHEQNTLRFSLYIWTITSLEKGKILFCEGGVVKAQSQSAKANAKLAHHCGREIDVTSGFYWLWRFNFAECEQILREVVIIFREIIHFLTFRSFHLLIFYLYSIPKDQLVISFCFSTSLTQSFHLVESRWKNIQKKNSTGLRRD